MNANGVCLTVVKDDSRRVNHYGIYKVWWDGGTHRKQLERYGDFNSCLYFIHEYYLANKGKGD